LSLTDNLSATSGSGDLVGEIDMLGQRLSLVGSASAASSSASARSSIKR